MIFLTEHNTEHNERVLPALLALGQKVSLDCGMQNVL